MKPVTPEDVRTFLIARYADQLSSSGIHPANVPDTFDLLLTGTIDSLGLLEMISELEKEFHTELDMSALDAEQMTVLGPLCVYVANQTQPNAGREPIALQKA